MAVNPFGVPINTNHSPTSQEQGHLPNPPDMTMRKPSKGGQGMNAGKGHGKGGMADGARRTSGKIDNARPANHANAMGLTVSSRNRAKGLSKPFGVKIDHPRS